MNMKSISRCFAFTFCALAFVALAHTSRATVLSYTPSPSDLNDLDHHEVYTWQIDNINLPTNSIIQSATLTFTNIANWDGNPNMLFVHLLDTSKYGGVASFQDVNPNQVPVTDIDDDFVDTRFHNSPGWLVAPGTADTALFNKSFTTTASTYIYTLTAAQLTALASYIANGNDIALGFDPDCHFFNDGITFTINYVTPIPEATTALPVFCLIAVAMGFELRRRRRAVKA
jgi:hypothetical protein